MYSCIAQWLLLLLNLKVGENHKLFSLEIIALYSIILRNYASKIGTVGTVGNFASCGATLMHTLHGFVTSSLFNALLLQLLALVY